jgi:hypothetical protein
MLKRGWAWGVAPDVTGRLLRWPGDCSWSRLTALLLGRLLGVLLVTGARSMGLAVQWTLMKPESWSGWFPLNSSPSCSYRWFHCDFQNVPREHPNCAARLQLSWMKSKWKLLYDWRSVSQTVCLDIEYPCGTCDQLLLPVGMLLSEIFGLVSIGRPLWREDGSAICSVITQWS